MLNIRSVLVKCCAIGDFHQNITDVLTRCLCFLLRCDLWVPFYNTALLRWYFYVGLLYFWLEKSENLLIPVAGLGSINNPVNLVKSELISREEQRTTGVTGWLSQLQVCQTVTQLNWGFIKPHEKDGGIYCVFFLVWSLLASDVCEVSAADTHI